LGVGNYSVAALIGAAIASHIFSVTTARAIVSTTAATGLVGVITLASAFANQHVGNLWLGWIIVTIGLAMTWTVTRSAIASYCASAAAIVSGVLAASTLSISDERFVVLTMITMSLLTGVAFTMQKRTPIDAAAAAASGVLVAASTLGIDPFLVSAIWFLIGLQATAYGFAARQPILQIVGTTLTLGALVSGWFTSGLGSWAARVLEPADIRPADLWMLALVGASFGLGWVVRRNQQLNSWAAYSAGLLLSATWLLSVHLERNTAWTIPTALTIGIATVAIGAWHRLAALLVGGTVMTAGTVFVAANIDLRALPTWTWLAVGGLALLGVAIAIERHGKSDSANLADLIARWD
jgi:hypothetical protein